MPPRALAIALALTPLVTAPEARAAETNILLTIESFAKSEALGGDARVGFVTGRALAAKGEVPQFDVLFLVDVSLSTRSSSGTDIDGDGKVASSLISGIKGIFGGGRSSSGDSILAAELAGVEALIETFDPRTTRVGVVSFSGGETKSADSAMLDVPLTTDYTRARKGLGEILLGGPNGMTNMYAGLRLAGAEVGGGRMAESEPRLDAQRHIVLLTDGYPFVPYESEETSERRAIAMARRLGERDIRVHVYAIGPDANNRPRAAVGIAEASGGSFTAVRHPSELQQMLAEASFASIDEVRVRNIDTGQAAMQVLRNPDGSYSALVPVQPGMNTIEVWARSTEGDERTVTRSAVFGARRLEPRERAALSRMLGLESQAARRRAEGTVEIEVESGEATREDEPER